MSPPDDAERAARLAAALRENLKRRKAQSKGRAADASASAPVADPSPNGAIAPARGGPPDAPGGEDA